MARGGARPGAGRPKVRETAIDIPRDIRAAAREAKLTPLEYMLAVMNDESADASRRDRMAQAAAPYVHARAEAVAGGKKAQRQERAEQSAAEGLYAVPDDAKLSH